MDNKAIYLTKHQLIIIHKTAYRNV